MSGEGEGRSGSDTGFALVAVLGFLLLAAAFTTPFLVEARIQALVTRNTGQFTRDKILLRGLIEVAAARFFERYQAADAALVSAVACPASGPDRPNVLFRFQDHSGLIDLNAAASEVLAIGFESLKMTRGEALRLAGETVRYRSVDDGHNTHSGYKHALFERSAELLDLLDRAQAAQIDIDRVFSVHSGTGTVDEAAAQGALLARLNAMPESERFFVVTGVRRGAAVTVAVELAYGSGRTVSGRAVLAPQEASGMVRFLEPPSFDRSVQAALPNATSSAPACADFFDPVLLYAIAKVTS